MFKNPILLWKKIISSELITNCVIHLRNSLLKSLDKNTVEYAYNLWTINESELIGTNGYSINWDGSCKLYSQFSDPKKTTFATLDFAVFHRYKYFV